jgi:hypothetical protein
MGVLATAAAYYIAKSKEIPRLHYALIVALGALSFFMMFSLSRPLWLLAPEMHFVQFPWRYAVPFGVAFSFLVAAAAGKSNKLAILAVGLFVLAGPLAKIVLAIKRPSSWNKAEISRLQKSIDNGIGYRGTPEYLPNSAATAFTENANGDSEITDDNSKELSTAGHSHDQYTFPVGSSQAGQITIRLFDYPTWQVNLDGSRVTSKLRDSEGRIVVSVPAGEHVIHIFMQREWDAKLGIAISIISAVVLSGLSFLPGLTSKQARPAAESMRSGVPIATLEHQALSMRNKP